MSCVRARVEAAENHLPGTPRSVPLRKLLAFGHTEVEARFLCLAATHSGYFTLRQFLDFAHAKSGKRNARLAQKLFSLAHAIARDTRA